MSNFKSSLTPPPIGTPINKSHPLAQGLVGCFLFNEGGGQKALNSVLSNNTGGTLTNGAIYQVKQRGSCVSLDGTNDYVQLGSTTTFNLPSACTLSAWINTNTVAAGTRQIICNSDAAGGIVQYTFEINRTTGGIVRLLANSGVIAVSSTTLLTANKWYHLVGSRSGTGGNWTYTIYINGVQDAQATGVTGNPNPHQIDSIGCGGNGAFQFFNGFIQDVKYYNRCLSATEVRQLYLAPYSMFVSKK